MQAFAFHPHVKLVKYRQAVCPAEGCRVGLIADQVIARRIGGYLGDGAVDVVVVVEEQAACLLRQIAQPGLGKEIGRRTIHGNL